MAVHHPDCGYMQIPRQECDCTAGMKEKPPIILFRKLGVRLEDPIVEPKNQRFGIDEPPDPVKCEHKTRISIDEEDRTLTCMGCGKDLDPFWVIKHWREIYRRQVSYVEAMNEHKLKEAERRKKEKERREKRDRERGR
jgi:hypothetical protein